jgi:hypothetical protein
MGLGRVSGDLPRNLEPTDTGARPITTSGLPLDAHCSHSPPSTRIRDKLVSHEYIIMLLRSSSPLFNAAIIAGAFLCFSLSALLLLVGGPSDPLSAEASPDLLSPQQEQLKRSIVPSGAPAGKSDIYINLSD